MEVADGDEEREQASQCAGQGRERRRALEKARDEQDQRIEEATAAAMVALEGRADAERALEIATSQVGEALKVLLAEDVPAEKAGALLELDVTEVRRLVKAAPAEVAATQPGRESGPGQRCRFAGGGRGRGCRAPGWLSPRWSCCGGGRR